MFDSNVYKEDNDQSDDDSEGEEDDFTKEEEDLLKKGFKKAQADQKNLKRYSKAKDKRSANKSKAPEVVEKKEKKEEISYKKGETSK